MVHETTAVLISLHRRTNPDLISYVRLDRPGLLAGGGVLARAAHPGRLTHIDQLAYRVS